MSASKYDYHSHTQYCHHADFTVEELVQKAIASNMTEIGISEHVFSQFKRRRYGLANYEEFLKYKDEVMKAKSKYAGQINVLVGLEVEIIDQESGKTPYELNNQLAKETDFLLYSFHYYDDGKHFSDVAWNAKRAHFLIKTYTELVKLSKVRYIAHPDAFMAGAKVFDENAKLVAQSIAALAEKQHIILGFNISGLAHNLAYPNRDFWSEIAKYNVEVKIELDAHGSVQFEPEYYIKAKQIAAQLGLKVIDKIDWKNLK